MVVIMWLFCKRFCRWCMLCRRRRFRPASSVPSPRNCSPLSQTWATVKNEDSSASNWAVVWCKAVWLMTSLFYLHLLTRCLHSPHTDDWHVSAYQQQIHHLVYVFGCIHFVCRRSTANVAIVLSWCLFFSSVTGNMTVIVSFCFWFNWF